jgi:hypothetical protein
MFETEAKIMKKIIVCIVLAVCVAFGAAACEKSDSEVAHIESAKTSAGEDDIVRYLNMADKDMSIYDFSSKRKIKSVKLWVEVYENGVLKATTSESGVPEYAVSGEDLYKGRIAVFTERSPEYRWHIFVDYNDNGVTYQSDSAENPEMKGIVGNAEEVNTSPSLEYSVIEEGKDITLCSTLFGNDNGLQVFSDPNENALPENLKNFSQAFFVKCRFHYEK